MFYFYTRVHTVPKTNHAECPYKNPACHRWSGCNRKMSGFCLCILYSILPVLHISGLEHIWCICYNRVLKGQCLEKSFQTETVEECVRSVFLRCPFNMLLIFKVGSHGCKIEFMLGFTFSVFEFPL